MLNTINHENVYDLDLQNACEIQHNNDLYQKDRPKWDENNPEQSLTKIRKYFKTICSTNKAPCLLANTLFPSSTGMLLRDIMTQTRQ